MKECDLVSACALSAAEGWNQTETDWRFLFSGKQNVCLVAEEDGQIAGTATALVHPPGLAWIGMVLVDKQMRGKGIGRMLMSDIINRLDHFQSLKLDATPAGLPLYRKLGFLDEYNLYRMTNPGFSGIPENSYGIAAKIDKTNIGYVLQSDMKIFGSDRSMLLSYLLNNNPGNAFAVFNSGKTEAYIFGRAGVKYSYIGPACGSGSDTVKKIIARVLVSNSGKAMALDIPEDKNDMILWLESCGFQIQRSFTRMYLKSNKYSGEPEFQYLISGPEFG
ncbi:MAG: GNAT family N-acetyltransferase [Bacteroidales bacterium]|nr:GNAT family N-acetyltransferase [Bacteroidales bacterium]